jgi:maltose alpha-D-glucosyltransferase/alpha-amylase
LKAVTIRDAIPVTDGGSRFHLAILLAEYVEGDPETYLLPLAVASGEKASGLRRDFPQAVVAELRFPDGGGGSGAAILFDAFYDPAFGEALLDAIARRRRFRGERGELAATRTRRFRSLVPEGAILPPTALKGEQSNTSLVYGDRLILKLFRRPEEGVNPDLEIGVFLTEKASFANVPPVAGALELLQARGESTTLAILQGYVPNQGDAWSYTLDALGRYFERAVARHAEMPSPPLPQRGALELAAEPTPSLVPRTIGSYLQSAELLGTRTAELHAALASGGEDPGFSPEPFSMLYQRSLYQSMRTAAGQTLHLLRRRLQKLPPAARPEAEAVLSREEEILGRLKTLLERKIEATRIRLHGDYHLGQVLFTGKDFVIVDFEGEPARPLTARRLKRSALVDVAGMLRSFHYAARSALLPGPEGGVVRPEDVATLEPWARFWNAWVAAEFLRSYLARAQGAGFLPREREELRILLHAHLLEKALYEVSYELQSRPAWVGVPLAGILEILESGGSEGGS